MIPVVQSVHTATAIDTVSMRYECPDCRWEGLAEILAVGRGESRALYGLFSGAAAEAAAERADEDLNDAAHALLRLVSCPKCGFHDPTVRTDYVRAKLHRLAFSSTGIAVVVTAAVVAIRYSLVEGLIVIAVGALAVAVASALAVRSYRRARADAAIRVAFARPRAQRKRKAR